MKRRRQARFAVVSMPTIAVAFALGAGCSSLDGLVDMPDCDGGACGDGADGSGGDGADGSGGDGADGSNDDASETGAHPTSSDANPPDDADGARDAPADVVVHNPPAAGLLCAGGAYTCRVASGSIECWGSNLYATLGIGWKDAMVHTTPTVIGTLQGMTSVFCGESHVCGIDQTGELWCWGSNFSGECGDGSYDGSDTAVLLPVQVEGIHHVVQAALGGSHTCALTEDGSVYCFGANDVGALGNGTTSTTKNPSPQRVVGLAPAVGITVGGAHSCALLSTGEVWCWGYNNMGQLGTGNTDDQAVPTPVQKLGPGQRAVIARHAVTCAVALSGDVSCWGYSPYTTGSHTPSAERSIPPGLTRLYLGWNHACADGNGGLYCWGANNQGEIGIGTKTPFEYAHLVSGLDAGTVAVALGGQDQPPGSPPEEGHSCVVTQGANPEIHCWGANDQGQLGDGTTQDRASP
jgi:hypothetical protein